MKLNVNTNIIIKNAKNLESNTKIVSENLRKFESNVKDDLIAYKCFCCNKNYQKN